MQPPLPDLTWRHEIALYFFSADLPKAEHELAAPPRSVGRKTITELQAMGLLNRVEQANPKDPVKYLLTPLGQKTATALGPLSLLLNSDPKIAKAFARA